VNRCHVAILLQQDSERLTSRAVDHCPISFSAN
jgi:hypothetical protein